MTSSTCGRRLAGRSLSLRPRSPGVAVGGLLPLIIRGFAGTCRLDWDGTSWAANRNETGRAAAAAQTVGVATIATGDIDVILTGLGAVTPLATVTVKTQINGQLQQLAFTEGQMVHKGDFLAQIDPRPYQVALEQAQGTLAHDTALLAQARADNARFQTLNRQDSISRQQADDQQYLIKQYQGTVVTDQAAVDSANLNLTYCHITSPVDGRVGIRLVDVGNYVQTSDSGLFVLTQLQPMSVLFTLPEDTVEQVQAQMNAGTLQVTAYDRTDTTLIATGTLATTDNQIDATTGTVKLRAMFPNTDNKLFPQQFVNAHLLVQTLKGVVIAPQAAIQQGAPGSFVYLVKPDNTVGIQVVKTGVTEGDPGANHRRAEGGRQGRDGWPGPVAGWGQDRHCAAARVRRRPATGAAPPPPAGVTGRKTADEPVPDLHPPPGRHHAADGGDPAGGHHRLSLPADLCPAGGRLPTIQVQTFYPGASPEVMTTAVTAPLERQFGEMPGLEPDVLRLVRRRLGHHAAIRAQPQPGRGGAGGAGRDQRRHQPLALRPAGAADL